MKRAFSLLEMLIVMLIVTIVAAASAPMISKKMLNDAANDSPWIWTNNNSIAFNLKGNDNTPAVIGAMQSPKKAMLYIETTSVPHISFASKNDRTPLNLKYLNGSVSLSTKDTTGKDSVVIGKNAESKFDSSVAIGTGVSTTANNQIMLGTSAETVKIPGTLDPNKANFGHLEGEIPFGTADSTLKVQGDLTVNSIYSGEDGSHMLSMQSYNNQGSRIKTIAVGDLNTNLEVASGGIVNSSNENIITMTPDATDVDGKRNIIILGDSNSIVKIEGDLVVAKNFATRKAYVDERLLVWKTNGIKGRDAADGYDRKISSVKFKEGGEQENSYLNESEVLLWEFSDRRLKNIGEEFKGGLDEIKKLQVFNYTFKKDKSKMPRVGVIAQDLEKIFPNAVIKGDDGFLRIRMEDIWYSIVNAVKQLDSRTTKITNDLKTAVADIIDLKSKVTNQEKLINELVEQNKSQDKIIKDLEKRLAKLEKKDK